MDKLKEYVPYIIIILVVILLRSFVVTPIKVNGSSMNKTLHNGEIMLLKKYAKNNLKRGDIVVVKYEKEKIIKRIVGLPEEDIEYKSNVLYIDDRVMSDDFAYGNTEDFKDYCAKDEYFVMGDNRENSLDSRYIGCIKKEQILGKTNLILFPFSKLGVVR